MMRLFVLSLMAGTPLAVMSAQDAAIAVATVILGGGGLFGVVKVWLAAQAEREKRADERLDKILASGKEERDEIHRRSDAMLDRMTGAMDGLTTEVRGLRSDQRAGLACRLSDPGVRHDVARPPSKPNGTRGG